MASVCRRAVALMLAIAAGSAVGFSQQPAPGQSPAAAPSPEAIKKAEQILAEARKALGGEKLATLKTLSASGRTRRVRGNNLVPIEFEILVEQPDKYVRIDEFPAEDTDPTSAGFSGDALIQIPPPSAMPMPGRGTAAPGGGPAGPPRDAGAAPAGRAAGPPAAAPPGAAPPGAVPPGGMPPGLLVTPARRPGVEQLVLPRQRLPVQCLPAECLRVRWRLGECPLAGAAR